MQDINVVSLLTKFSGDIVVGAVVASLCALVLKRLVKSSMLFFLAVAFVCAFSITFLLKYLVLKYTVVDSLSGGFTAGALALVLTAFIKRFAFTDKEELKSGLEKLLSSIILSKKLDDVVNEVIDGLINNKCVEKGQIEKVLKDCLEGETDEKTIRYLTDFVYDLMKAKNDDE